MQDAFGLRTAYESLLRGCQVMSNGVSHVPLEREWMGIEPT